jgi:hypothetical protein
MDPRKARQARVVFLLWVIVAVLYFQLALAYVSASRTDQQFGEYLQRMVQMVGSQKRTARELRQLIHGKAEELGIPLDPARIDIRGRGEDLELSLSYSLVIEMPLISIGSFHKEFEHEVEFMLPR